jgi:HrpA-like RNA helicase
VAAVTVAARVAEEAKCELGGLVGYEIRFDKKTSPATKIKFASATVLQLFVCSIAMLAGAAFQTTQIISDHV